MPEIGEAAANEAKKVLKADEHNVRAMQLLAQVYFKESKVELAKMVLENARAIVAATPLPVSADLEDGFGRAPAECAAGDRLIGPAARRNRPQPTIPRSMILFTIHVRFMPQ